MEYGYPIVVTPGVASARLSPFSFTTMPIISGRSAPPGREELSFAITSSLSAICFTCFGETKLTASICLNPASTNSFKYSALYSVGMKSCNPCHASLGHSTSFAVSMRLRKSEEVEGSKLKVEREDDGKLSFLRFDSLPQTVKHSRKFRDVSESGRDNGRRNV